MKKKDLIELTVAIIIIALFSYCSYHKGYENGFDDCTKMFINN